MPNTNQENSPKRRIGRIPEKYKKDLLSDDAAVDERQFHDDINDFLRRKRGPQYIYESPSDEEWIAFLEEEQQRKSAEERGETYIPRNYYEESKPFEWKGLFLFLFGGGWATKVIIFSFPTFCILAKAWDAGITVSFAIMGITTIILGLYYCMKNS